MKLYEINTEIQRLSDQLCFDEATGELLGDADILLSEISCLELERKNVLEYLAKLVLNLRAEEAALKAEESRLKERRMRLEKKEDRLMEVLDRECAGEKTDLGVATFSYRRTSRLAVEDAEKAVRWLKRNKYSSCFRVPPPEIAKAEVKRLIGQGVSVPGCIIVADFTHTLK